MRLTKRGEAVLAIGVVSVAVGYGYLLLVAYRLLCELVRVW